jgi:predicted aspartyl protease
MNLPLHSSVPAILADGSQVLSSIHLATIVWDNVEKVVFVLASANKPLLGTGMMNGYHLGIDFKDNGSVSLEKTAPKTNNKPINQPNIHADLA